VQRLSELLPPTFEDLERDFAVGVVTADGEHVLVDQGPLPAAVAASAAIPFIFSSVDVPGKDSSCAMLDWKHAGGQASSPPDLLQSEQQPAADDSLSYPAT
jgi:predicted acylesterase/phospholipase RssA